MGEREQDPVLPPDVGELDAAAPAGPANRDLPPAWKDIRYAEEPIVILRDDDKA